MDSFLLTTWKYWTTFIHSDLDEEKYEAYLSLRDVFPDEKISCQKFRLHFCSIIPQLQIQIQSASIHSADNIFIFTWGNNFPINHNDSRGELTAAVSGLVSQHLPRDFTTSRVLEMKQSLFRCLNLQWKFLKKCTSKHYYQINPGQGYYM